MSRPFRIRTLGDIVHAELGSRFVISLEHLMPLWADVLATARERRLRRVLIEGINPERRMEPFDAYTHGDFLSGLERPGLRVAFCLYGYEPDALTAHFVNISNSGACTVKFFDDIDTAITWVGM
ncbi:MAG: hypothetical protein AB7I32_02270 [Gammaproteobacteria bacterium]